MEQYLDVSMLEPCEPMERILTAIGELTEGDYIKVVHRREPHPIYPMLEQAGFAWRIVAGGPSEFQLFIWHRNDRAAAETVARQLG